MTRPINLERLHEATDQQLADAYARALQLAHDAPKDMPNEGMASPTWAVRSREAFRIGDEIARREKNK